MLKRGDFVLYTPNVIRFMQILYWLYILARYIDWYLSLIPAVIVLW